MGSLVKRAETRVKTMARNLKGDKVIWLIIVCFAMISLLVVYSSTSALAYRFDDSPFKFMAEQFLYYIIGFAILLLCYRINLGFYRWATYLIFGASIILLLIPLATGELRSFRLGPINIQPSEIAKISVVMYLAKVIETCKLDTFKDYALKILLPLGVVLVLCLIGSVSVTLIITAVAGTILLTSKINKKFILYTIPIVIVMLGLMIGIHKMTGFFSRFDTFEARVERFVSSEDQEMTPAEIQEKKDKDFQAQNAIEAIQLGKLTGRGPGNSLKRDILPNAYDDYIYSIIVEEYGLFGGIIVIWLYLWFFIRCIRIAQSCKKEYSTIVVLGLSFLIVLQAFLHILVNIGIFPVTGQTLPMISKGGSSLVIMSIAFGVILAINRTIEISKSKNTIENK